MASNLSQYNISHWRNLYKTGELDKSVSRLDVYDRVIEVIATRSELTVGDAALKYICGYLDNVIDETKAEAYTVVIWTQANEDSVNNIQSDGTIST